MFLEWTTRETDSQPNVGKKSAIWLAIPKKVYLEQCSFIRAYNSIGKSKTHTRKAVFTVMITSKGLFDNAYARDVQGEVVMEEMFE